MRGKKGRGRIRRRAGGVGGNEGGRGGNEEEEEEVVEGLGEEVGGWVEEGWRRVGGGSD